VVESTDISYGLIDGIYNVLKGQVKYNGKTIPVYKTVPKRPESLYIEIGEVMGSEDGTKDDFVFFGTVQVIVVDESRHCADRRHAQRILGEMRKILKSDKGSVFSVAGAELVVFSHETMLPIAELSDESIVRSRIIDIYNYVIN